MKRCKIGDRAFIINSDFPENLGKIVKIVNRSKYYFADWLIESEGSPIKAVNLFGEACYGPRVNVLDSRLIPIRGELEKESEKEKEVA